MNDPDPFEEELRRLRPAAPPEDFQARLLGVVDKPTLRARAPTALGSSALTWLAGLLRPRTVAWVAVAAVVMLAAALFLWQRSPATVPPVSREVADFVPDSITLSQEVLARYDGGIVQRPDGQAVRLTCYDRVNRVILKDSRRGSVVERREPQREIVPVPIDVY